MEGLAQVGGGAPHAAAPAVDGAAVAGRAQEVPQQGQRLLLHHLGLTRVQLRHQVWGHGGRGNKKESGTRIRHSAEGEERLRR